MTVYLLHADQPYIPVGCQRKPWCWLQHYAGWCPDLDRRMAKHRNGQGSNVCRVWKEQGITFQLARTWPGTRIDERRLKDSHHLPRYCPLCHPMPRIDRWAGGREMLAIAPDNDPVLAGPDWGMPPY